MLFVKLCILTDWWILPNVPADDRQSP